MKHIDNGNSYALQNMDFRHEDKYICSDAELTILRARLDAVMNLDVHTDKTGVYQIRSIYFDDYDDNCWNENDAGNDLRNKWRIRAYNGDSGHIFLENKFRKSGMIHKEQAMISREQMNELLSKGKKPDISCENPRLLNKFIILRETRLFHPVVIVCYERRPYVFGPGNVRVTLDRNIRSSKCFGSFFDNDIPARPVMQPGMHLLEVKYDDFLPDVIQQVIQMQNMQKVTFSKYYLCRLSIEKGAIYDV